MGIVFMAMFQAYALLQNLQFHLKKTMGVGQSGELAMQFTNAVTMVHVGKLISRLGHEVVFACVRPVVRVYIAMCCALVGAMVPAICIYGYGSRSIVWVFVSYGLIGIGIGVFEATFLAVITPLGRQTKFWAILGIPTGFFTIGVPGILLVGLGLHPTVLYWYVVLFIGFSMIIVYRHAPHDVRPVHNESQSISRSFKAWRMWLPMLLPHLVGKVFVNFGMENLFPVIGFTFNAPVVPLSGPTSNDLLMQKDTFLAIENVLIFIGDTASRRIPYLLSLRTYRGSLGVIFSAMSCIVIAFTLCKLATAWISWISAFLAFFGNGLVYAVGSRHIDNNVPKAHHMTAYSVWCFFGDISSVVGAKMQDVVRDWICGGSEYQYECRPS